MITAVALSPSVDVSYVVDELVLGQLHRPSSVHRQAGGKSLNTARAAVAVGARARSIAILGGDSGEFIANELVAAGIELHAVKGGRRTRSCVSIASVTDGRMTEVYESATAVSRAEWNDVLDAVRRLLPTQTGWLVVSGSVPESLGVEALADLVRLAAEFGVSTAIDSHGPPLAAAVDSRPALVKVNRFEAAAMLGRNVDGELLEFARTIRMRSGGTVVVTDGEAGSVATDDRESWLVERSDTVGGFPVGSGDSFLGGMLAALDDGADLADALRLGVGCATANALVPGAACFDPEQARSLATAATLSRL